MVNSIESRVELNNGVEMPYLGLGTYSITTEQGLEQSIVTAYNLGYRMLDTARMYNNEEKIGKVIKKNNIPREDLFITSKLWTDEHGYKNAVKAIESSLNNLGLEYIDLYLIHWPGGGKRIETWEAMVTALNEGKCRAIGVSNFTIRHLQEILDNSNVVPTVNQVEFNPFIFPKKLLEYCNSERIQLEAYSPLVRATKFKNKNIMEMSKTYSKSPAQIMIRWALQHSVIAIPKSSNPKRIEENAAVFDFEIDENDMKILNSIG